MEVKTFLSFKVGKKWVIRYFFYNDNLKKSVLIFQINKFGNLNFFPRLDFGMTNITLFCDTFLS